MPLVPLAEAIERAGLQLRRSHAPLVYTSPRRIGRALGGFADLLDSYATDPAALCDAALEPVATLIPRLVARARYCLASLEGFAATWPAIDAAIARRRVAPAQLPDELALAERVIAQLERRAALRPGNPPLALPRDARPPRGRDDGRVRRRVLGQRIGGGRAEPVDLV